MRAAHASPARTWLTLGVGLLGLLVLGPTLGGPRYRAGDWGPHHALTRALARGLAEGHVPRYLTSVSTGDSPYETYPFPTYGLAAALVRATGDEANAPAVLAALGVLAHAGIAAAMARLALWVAPWPLAAGVGLLALFDVGSFETGAANSILEVGLLHAAWAQCFALFGLDAVLELLAGRVGITTIVRLWLCAGAAAAFHPSGVIFLGAMLPVLVLVGAAAKDAHPRRAWSAALHLATGLLATAFVWMPFAERMVQYGLHVASPAPSLTEAAVHLVALRQLRTSWPLPLEVGFLGLLLSLPRRRGAEWAMAILGLGLLLGSTEIPHRLLFDWFPATLARWQCFRFVTLARPLVFVAAAAAAFSAWCAIERRAPRVLATRMARTLALASATLTTLVFSSRTFPPGITPLFAAARAEVPDPAGFAELVKWAAAEQARVPPGTIARALWDGPSNAGHHLMADSGMPVFAMGDAVGMMLRERAEDRSPESLRRFDVRWIVFRERAQWLGDPRSERHFGSYNVRELPEWDGQPARIEKGAGRLSVQRLEEESIDLELTETDAPALVALGIGYYPRWRAQRADGSPVEVFAVPATPSGSVRVPAAWIAPGRTVFRADARLPSEGSGIGWTAFAAGIAAVAIVLRARGAGRQGLRRAARAFSRPRLAFASRLASAALVGAALVLAGLPRGSDPALRLVRGIAPRAEVAARVVGGSWQPCAFSWIRRDFDCPGLGRVTDATAYLIRDHPSSTAFLTPSVVARSTAGRVEYRIRVSRPFSGRFWAAGAGSGSASLACGGEQALKLEKAKSMLQLDARGDGVACELTLRTRGRDSQEATLVRQTAIDVDRTTDVPWAPSSPPAAVRAAR